jgi:hypothetical protein
MLTNQLNNEPITNSYSLPKRSQELNTKQRLRRYSASDIAGLSNSKLAEVAASNLTIATQQLVDVELRLRKLLPGLMDRSQVSWEVSR